MKRVVLSLLDEYIQVAVGAPGPAPKLNALYLEPVEAAGPPEPGGPEDGSLSAWEAAIARLWDREKLPRRRVYLVLPGRMITVKTIDLPPMQEKRLSQAVRDELRSREDRELVTDFLPLERTDAGGWRVLAGACPREVFEDYLAMVRRLGLRLEGVTIPVTPILNLLDKMREVKGLREGGCILLSFEGSCLFSILVESGVYRYAGRSRLLSEPGTLDFGVEVARKVSGTLQFQAAAHFKSPVAAVYYAGCSQSDFEVCVPGSRELGLWVERLPDCGAFHSFPEGKLLADWLNCAGLMFA